MSDELLNILFVFGLFVVGIPVTIWFAFSDVIRALLGG